MRSFAGPIERIARIIESALGLAQTVLNVGARHGFLLNRLIDPLWLSSLRVR